MDTFNVICEIATLISTCIAVWQTGVARHEKKIRFNDISSDYAALYTVVECCDRILSKSDAPPAIRETAQEIRGQVNTMRQRQRATAKNEYNKDLERIHPAGIKE